ncbi:hypothetical protein C8R44DRAFT_793604 [Mycena epipterygia]|nr:hypothetical protein C8R44DRAFT_793604 [Mycena epipterygia]
MLSFILLFAAAVRLALADNITVTDPTNAVQCLPYTFSWSGGIPPYIVEVSSIGYNNLAPALQIFLDVNETTITWNQTVGFTGPVLFTLVVSDSAGAMGQSVQETLALGDVTVDEAGNCLNNATLSATDTLTGTAAPFRTSTPGALQSGFSISTIVPTTVVGSAAGAKQTGAARLGNRMSLGASVVSLLLALTLAS